MSTDFYFALYVFCMDYHNGMNSRLYRIMSRFHNKYWNIQLADSHIKRMRQSETYANLVKNYSEDKY